MGGQPVTKTVKFEPIETVERLYVRVARRVADMVSSGQLAPGEKLPSERDLADLLKVSRPSIREAMIALEVSGVIEVKTGSGIYVKDPAKRYGLTDDGAGPFEILEMRLIVEPEACALAAERMLPANLVRIQQCYARMESTAGTPDMEAADCDFHTAIADATQNAVIAKSVERLWEMRAQSLLSKGFHRLIIDEGVYPALHEHQRIVAALQDRDGEAARRAMREHLEASTAAAAQHFARGS